MFIDESGANTKMTRLYGRSPIGKRLVCRVPHGHYQTTTMIAAVRLRGPQAPWLFDGAMDGELFLAWVEQGLGPCLEGGGRMKNERKILSRNTAGREGFFDKKRTRKGGSFGF